MKKLHIVCLSASIIFSSFSACISPHTRTPSTLITPVDSLQQSDNAVPDPHSTIAPYNILNKTISIQLVDNNEQPIREASVRLSSSSVSSIELKSNQKGIITFQSIPIDQFYNLYIQATGYVHKQVNHVNLFSSRAPIRFTLFQEKYIFGQINDAEEEPIEGAIISSQNSRSTLSDEDGRFKLQYETQFPTELTINREGYVIETKILNNSSLSIYNLGSVKLKKKNQALNGLIYLANHIQLTKERFALLNSNLLNQGFNIQFVGELSLTNLSNVDVVFIPSPNQKLSINEINQLKTFVNSGGKLILSGEWSGFGEFNIDVANQILEPFGLQFGNDLLRGAILSNSGDLKVIKIIPHYITTSISQIQLYQATSVYMSKQNIQSKILARVADNAFRIAKTATSLKLGSFGVLGVSLVGKGRVIAIGDTSLWLNDDTDNNQVPNFNEAQNQLLAQRIFKW